MSVFRIGVVGDCSQNSPPDLSRALDAAMANSDVVVQVGDLNPGYDEIKAHLNKKPELLVVPGNHDTQWDPQFGSLLPHKNWKREDLGGVTLIGLDNSGDTITPEGWAILNQPLNGTPVFVFMHKGLSTLVLPDGTESNHIMGEGSTVPDAEKLKDWLRANRVEAIACGHYHGASVMKTNYGVVILDGRGGSMGYHGSTVTGYSVICVHRSDAEGGKYEGWTVHQEAI